MTSQLSECITHRNIRPYSAKGLRITSVFLAFLESFSAKDLFEGAPISIQKGTDILKYRQNKNILHAIYSDAEEERLGVLDAPMVLVNHGNGPAELEINAHDPEADLGTSGPQGIVRYNYGSFLVHIADPENHVDASIDIDDSPEEGGFLIQRLTIYPEQSNPFPSEWVVGYTVPYMDMSVFLNQKMEEYLPRAKQLFDTRRQGRAVDAMDAGVKPDDKKYTLYGKNSYNDVSAKDLVNVISRSQ